MLPGLGVASRETRRGSERAAEGGGCASLKAAGVYRIDGELSFDKS